MGLTTMKLDLVNMNVLIILPGLAYGASIPAKTVSEIKKTTIDDTELLRVQTWAVETIGPKTRVELDETDNGCVWIGAADGQAFPCPTGYQAVGVCGVGAYADCNGYFFELQCCNMNLPTPDSSSWSTSGTQVITGGCGSGPYFSCQYNGVNYYVTMQNSNYENSGYYYFKMAGSYSGASGQRISCGNVDGMGTGDYTNGGGGIGWFCGSGYNPACTVHQPGTGYTYIQCASFAYCNP